MFGRVYCARQSIGVALKGVRVCRLQPIRAMLWSTALYKLLGHFKMFCGVVKGDSLEHSSDTHRNWHCKSDKGET